MKTKNNLKVGNQVYIEGSYSISNGSSDVDGGLATIEKITNGMSAGKQCRFIELKGIPGHSYNWDTYLKPIQASLKKQYGKQKAAPNPDIDTPWIEDGDIVNGQVYRGRPIH